MIKVLVVDDSAVVRQTLVEVLGTAPGIEVVATAADPYIAVEKLRRCRPDVIILDIEMPRMDGLTFLNRLMAQHPMPVVICSSLVGEGSETQMRALECGAVDIIAKPMQGTRRFLEESRGRLVDAIRGAAQARVRARPSQRLLVEPKRSADAILSLPENSRSMARTTERLILLGASTGGTEAIRRLLQAMPSDCPAIGVVQHMPEGFTRAFANRLDQLCNINVKEAEDGDTLLRGHALIAPGNRHMLIKRSGARYHVELHDGPLVGRHRPSVNVLFRSAARYAGANAVGVILTGMGDDGADGLLEMRSAGASTLGQDEATSVVYGMPREAFIRGAVQQQLGLDQLAGAMLKAAS